MALCRPLGGGQSALNCEPVPTGAVNKPREKDMKQTIKTPDTGELKPVKIEEYNSNNAWGFGGARGTMFTYESGARLLLAYACTRHHGEFPFCAVYTKDNKGVFDLSGANIYSTRPEYNDILTVLKTGSL